MHVNSHHDSYCRYECIMQNIIASRFCQTDFWYIVKSNLLVRRAMRKNVLDTLQGLNFINTISVKWSSLTALIRLKTRAVFCNTSTLNAKLYALYFAFFNIYIYIVNWTVLFHNVCHFACITKQVEFVKIKWFTVHLETNCVEIYLHLYLHLAV